MGVAGLFVHNTGSKADTEGADLTSLSNYDYGLHNTSRRLLPTVTSCHVIVDTVTSLCKWSIEKKCKKCVARATEGLCEHTWMCTMLTQCQELTNIHSVWWQQVARNWVHHFVVIHRVMLQFIRKPSLAAVLCHMRYFVSLSHYARSTSWQLHNWDVVFQSSNPYSQHQDTFSQSITKNV